MIRVVIASPMKCGSTFVTKVLSNYFAIPDIKLFIRWGWQDHILLPEMLNGTPNSFIMQTHLKPSRPTLQCIAQFDLRAFCLWRNIGDVVVSLADHIKTESNEIPVCYIPNRRRFLQMKTEEQHQFLIKMALPWYLAYWKLWRPYLYYSSQQFYRYEFFLQDQTLFFTKLIEMIDPTKMVDVDRLNRCIEISTVRGTRKNVGIKGRSVNELSFPNKKLIEEMIEFYMPEDPGPLLSELPWFSDHHNGGKSCGDG